MLEFDPRALAAVERLRRAGFDAALVGGCVRDSLLGLPPHDYDAATAARPEEIRALFAGCPQYDAGSRFGTVAVELDGLWVEVTTFRREEGYADHRRPDRVAFSPRLEDDLARRDFTINAMAWGPAGLVDRSGGRADLERRLVRCVGDPDRRFQEDALRPLRGLRLAAQLDFALEEETAAAVRRHLPELSHVAWERVREEFLRLICSPGAGRVLLDFPEMAVQVLPELGPAVGFDQRNFHHLYDVYTHSVRTLEGVSPSPALRLAALLHDVGKPSTFTLDESGTGHFYGHDRAGLPLADRALERLRVDRETRERALLLIARHHLPVEDGRRWAGRWARRLGTRALLELLELKGADGAACGTPDGGQRALLDRARAQVLALAAEGACLSLRTLAVNGRDARAAGLSGPAVGVALNALLDRVAQGELENDRETLLRELERFQEGM